MWVGTSVPLTSPMQASRLSQWQPQPPHSSCCSCSYSSSVQSHPRQAQPGTQQSGALHRQQLLLHRPHRRRQGLQPLRAGTELGDLIGSEEEYNKHLKENDVIVIDWMARWCRKCVYLSPKLRKLMAEDFPEIPIVFIDVNAVPGNIVYDAGVRKMPTITIFKHGEKVREHIAAEGGLKAITHIREMIRDFVDGGGMETDN